MKVPCLHTTLVLYSPQLLTVRRERVVAAYYAIESRTRTLAAEVPQGRKVRHITWREHKQQDQQSRPQAFNVSSTSLVVSS